jgi:putative methionine-R-sulfoxide reductase with GAF domain
MTTLRGPDPYALAEERLAALESAPGGERSDRAACAILHESVPTHSWVGIYRTQGAALALVAWAGGGAPAARHLPLGAGDVVRVTDDVRADPQARALFPATRAEIVVPLAPSRAGAGVLVIASEHRGAFGPADRALLGRVGEWASGL